MRSLSSNLSPRRAIVLVTIATSLSPVAAARAQNAKPFVQNAKPFVQNPKPFVRFSKSAHTLRDSIVQMARAQLGRRYRYGGETPEKGFDCSGLVTYIMSSLKLDVPRTAKEQATQGVALSKDTSILLPGDLLTFGQTKNGVSHVGIYVGHGKYIHASSVAGRVIESDIDRPVSSLVRGWRGARRLAPSNAGITGDSLGHPTNKGSSN
jgi:cell wall-associated NlpC family hydrolase